MVVVGRECTDLVNERRHLARIRCIKECTARLLTNQPLPPALGYCAAQVEYSSEKSFKLTLYERPCRASATVGEFNCTPNHVVTVSGEELSNDEGLWKRFITARLGSEEVKLGGGESERWLLLLSMDPTAVSNALVPVLPRLVHCTERSRKSYDKLIILKSNSNIINDWLDVVEHEYSVKLSSDCVPAPVDAEAVVRLLSVPVSWSIERDEELAAFLAKNLSLGTSSLGSVKEYVESIEVSSQSSQSDREYESALTDNDPTTYWESGNYLGVGSLWRRDGSHEGHCIRLHMKAGVVIKKLWVTVSDVDSRYMPQVIAVMGGPTPGRVRKLNEVHIDQSIVGVSDVLILSDQAEFVSVLDICIKECREQGMDTRIHGIKIKSNRECDLGISRDLFSKANLCRYPRLDGIEPDLLYRRAVLLERLMKLVDSVLHYIVPSWEFSSGACDILKNLRQLLPLSQKRMLLVDHILEKTQLPGGSIPKLYINRYEALAHRANPTLDVEYRNSIFTQIYEGLKPRDSNQSPQHYRWGVQHDQWWECKFISEGVINLGGGFRDSISDLSEELCPSTVDTALPLPFFVRSPNQRNADASCNRDMYVLNPSCMELHKYNWIGHLMGACLRGKEFLILSLPEIFWKQLIGQPVSWQKDFYAVDEYQVRSTEHLLSMDAETYRTYYNERPLTWCVTLSDGSTVPLKPDGEVLEVGVDEREEYVRLVTQARLCESSKQLAAIREGLIQVVPQAVLDLLTHQELETRICGDPEISITALKKYVKIFNNIPAINVRTKDLWTAIENFSNDDRSRLLRFVTGRRRLPASMQVFWSDYSQDFLPAALTCSSSLYIPYYSSAKILEEKLRYAIYNCVTIATH